MDSRMHADDGPTLGAVLRLARERRGMTVEDVAEVTKIRRRHLEALEADDLAALPPLMYQRGEVRAYADAVGLDRDVALEWLARAHDAPVHAAEPGPAVQPPIAEPRWRLPIAIAALTIVAVIAVWPRPGGEQPATDAVHAVTASTLISAPTPTSPAVPAPARPLSVGTSGSGVADAVPLSVVPVAEVPQVPATPLAHVVPELEVITEPPGAHVTVDGIGWGVTPVTIRHLPPGSKRVRVTWDGHASTERLTTLAADRQTTSVHIALDEEQ